MRPGAKKRTSTRKGVVKRVTLSQIEKDARKESARIAREENEKQLEEKISKMGLLEYSNFVADQRRAEAVAEKERKKQRMQ